MTDHKPLQVAMEKGCDIKMIYQKQDEIITRIVTPHALKGNLLICYDHYKRARRSYRLDRILAVEVLNAR